MAILRPGVLSVSPSVYLNLEFYRSFWVSFFIDAWLLLSEVSRPVIFAGEAVAKLIMGFSPRFRWVMFLVSKEALRHSRVWGKGRTLGRPLIFPTPMVLDMTHKTTKSNFSRRCLI